MDVEARLNELEGACRAAGARVTHQRREVLRAVVETDEHPSAQSVLRCVREWMPTISFDTVYRTLAFLEEHKLIHRVHATGERPRFDGNHNPHYHFICTEWGRIIDFERARFDEIELSEEVNGLGTSRRWQLQVFGICRNCERRREGRDG